MANPDRVDERADGAVSDAELLAELRAENQRLAEMVVRWRAAALETWTEGAYQVNTELRKELDEVYETVSWRVTRPLRAVRRRLGGQP